MFDLALKDIKEHKVRTFLTVLGVIIAISAIVTLGSISEGMNSLVMDQTELFGGVIEIVEAGTEPSPTAMASTKIDLDILDDIKSIDGVEDAVPALARQIPMQGMIFGLDLSKLEMFGLGNLKIEDGRWPDPGAYEVAIGDFVTENLDIGLGDYLEIEGTEVEVVGILEKTDGFMDILTLLEFETAQDLFDEHETATSMYARVRDPRDSSFIADEIEAEFDTIQAWSSEEGAEMAEEMIGNIRLITLGIGIIAAVVAAIGIINTMFMSVSEKTRQIGIMKAVGAEEKQIMRQILEEAVVLSIFGGALGLLFGFIGTSGLNFYIGMPLAKVTPLLAGSAFFFGIFLSMLAAYYPALQASKINPIDAIRGVK